MKGGMSRKLVVAISLVLLGCSPKVVGIYNEGALKTVPKTFHLYATDEVESLSLEEQEFDNKLLSIIREDLNAKGLSESSLPDIYISFIINVHASEETTQNTMSRFDYYRFYNYGYYDPTQFTSRTYKQGVLIIDIKNYDNKLVWQGSKAFKLSSRKSSRNELLIACQEIIAGFDPVKVL